MSNRSYVQFGGLAALLITLTAWMAVALYFALVPAAEQRPIADAGAFLTSFAANPAPTTWFIILQAVNAFASLFAVVAVYYRLRHVGEAWALVGAILGAITAVVWMYALAHNLEQTQFAAMLYNAGQTETALLAFDAPSAINPYLLSTSGLASIWFLITGLLILNSRWPRLLGILALVAFFDLLAGFIGAAIGNEMISTLTAVVAGAVGGPVFWLWMGLLLLRTDASDVEARELRPAHAGV